MGNRTQRLPQPLAFLIGGVDSWFGGGGWFPIPKNLEFKCFGEVKTKPKVIVGVQLAVLTHSHVAGFVEVAL